MTNAESGPLKRTPLYEVHRKLGARLVPYAGWEMPVQYSGVKAEHTAVRTAVGLFDVSHMGELFVRGAGALQAVNALITNDLERAETGQAVYTCCCNEQGNILDDLIVYRLADEEILVVCNAANLDKIREHFSSSIRGPRVEDESAETALIAVQGPQALQLVQQTLSSPIPGELRAFRIADVPFRQHRVRVARTGYTGEEGVELFCDNDVASALYLALLEDGAPVGALPVGLAARDTLRLEARLALYGNDISESTNPIEAGLAWTVKFKKSNFVGKSALEAVKQQGPERQLVGFEMVGRGIARQGYPLLDLEGKSVGECTSGAPSPTLGKNIGLGYLPSSMSAIGTEFLVDCRGKQINARVVQTPFYKRAS